MTEILITLAGVFAAVLAALGLGRAHIRGKAREASARAYADLKAQQAERSNRVKAALLDRKGAAKEIADRAVTEAFEIHKKRTGKDLTEQDIKDFLERTR